MLDSKDSEFEDTLFDPDLDFLVKNEEEERNDEEEEEEEEVEMEDKVQPKEADRDGDIEDFGEEESWEDIDSDEPDVDSDLEEEEEEDDRPTYRLRRFSHQEELPVFYPENRPLSKPLTLQEFCVEEIFDHMRDHFSVFSTCDKALPWPIKSVWFVAEDLNIDTMKAELFYYFLLNFHTDKVRRLIKDVVKTSPRLMKNLLAFVVDRGLFTGDEIDIPYDSDGNEMEGMDAEEEEEYLNNWESRIKAISPINLSLADQCVGKLVTESGHKDASYARDINSSIVRGRMDKSTKNEFFRNILGRWDYPKFGKTDEMQGAVEFLIKAHPNYVLDLWNYATKVMLEDDHVLTEEGGEW